MDWGSCFVFSPKNPTLESDVVVYVCISVSLIIAGRG